MKNRLKFKFDSRSARKWIVAGLALASGVGWCSPLLAQSDAGSETVHLRTTYGIPEVEVREGEETLVLSRADCFALAMENNLDIAIAELQPRMDEGTITSAQGEFDPVVGVNSGYLRRKQPQGAIERVFGAPSSTQAKIVNFASSLGGKLITGTAYSLVFQFDNTRSTFNRFQTEVGGSLVLSLTQPLLRGGGIRTNRFNIRIAQINRKTSWYEAKRRVMDTIHTVEQRYWDLVFALKNLEVQQSGLNRAEELLRQNRRKVAVGALAPLVVTQAEAQVAEARGQVIQAGATIQDAEDELLRMLNVSAGSRLWNMVIVPIEPPEITDVELDEQKSLELAFHNRPEFRQFEMAKKNAELSLAQARNGMLPDLSLSSSYGWNARRESGAKFLGDIRDADAFQFNVGLNFTYPLGNRAARGKVVRARHSLTQADLTLLNTKLTVARTVRQAIRNVDTNRRLIDSASEARRLAREQLDAEERRLEAGVSTTFQVLEFQDQMTAQEGNELRAVMDYLKSIAMLRFEEGTILDTNGIEFEDEPTV